jgi:hypothetical protein
METNSPTCACDDATSTDLAYMSCLHVVTKNNAFAAPSWLRDHRAVIFVRLGVFLGGCTRGQRYASRFPARHPRRARDSLLVVISVVFSSTVRSESAGDRCLRHDESAGRGSSRYRLGCGTRVGYLNGRCWTQLNYSGRVQLPSLGISQTVAASFASARGFAFRLGSSR